MAKKTNTPKKKQAVDTPMNLHLKNLKKELEQKEEAFNNDILRFIKRHHRGIIRHYDLSAPWSLLERELRKTGLEDEHVLQEYKRRNSVLSQQKAEILSIRDDIDKNEKGKIHRSQPVLQLKHDWIIEQSGQFRSIKDIHQDLTKKQGFSIDIRTVKSFIAEHKVAIDKYKEEFKTEIFNTSIATDAGRLKWREEVFNYYNDKWRRDGKAVDFNICNRILNDVQNEIKGDVTIKIDGKIDITHSIEANKSLAQKFGELNINLINVGLAAQKSGVNPLPLMAQLTNSYYKKWNGIADAPLSLEDKEQMIPISGLVKSYNWQEIKEKNKEPLDMGKVEDAYIVTNEEEKQTFEDRKSKLLDLIKNNDKTNLEEK